MRHSRVNTIFNPLRVAEPPPLTGFEAELDKTRRFGIKPDRYTGFVGGIRSYLTSEGRQIRQAKKVYKSKPMLPPRVNPNSEAGREVKELLMAYNALDPEDPDYDSKRQFYQSMMDRIAYKAERGYEVMYPDIRRQRSYDEEAESEAFRAYPYNMFGAESAKNVVIGYPVLQRNGTMGRHAVAVMKRDNKFYYADPAGTPYDEMGSPDSQSKEFITRMRGNLPMIELNDKPPQTLGACLSLSYGRIINPDQSRYLADMNAASQRTGLTHDQVALLTGLHLYDEINKYERDRIVERGDWRGYKKGGLVTVAKETYSKTPEDVGDYKLVKKTPTMLIYQKGDHYVVGVRGTNDLEDVKADVSIPFGIKNTSRFKKDEKTLREWKASHPGSYTGVGHSLGGAILDELINDGLIESATSYNPAMGTETGKNKRIYAEHDPLRTIGRPDEIVKTKHSILGHAFPIGRAIESHSLNNFPDTEEMRHQITEVPLVEKRRLGGDKGMQKVMKSGGVVEKVKRVAKKVKEVAEHVGKEVVKEAKKHSHKLKDAGKAAGAALGTAGGAAAATAVGAPEAAGLASTVGSALGSKLGEFLGEKAHEGIQSLKKGGRVRKPRARPVKQADIDAAIKKEDDAHRKAERADKSLGVQNLKVVRERKLGKITDTAPMKHKATVEDKKKKPVFKEGGKVKKPSAWMAHVKAHHAKVGGSYKDAMKSAKATYKSST